MEVIGKKEKENSGLLVDSESIQYINLVILQQN